MTSSFPRRITIFGSTGFLGRAVVQALARQGCLLRLPIRSLDKAEILQTAGIPRQITVVPSLMRTDAETLETLGEADAVVNLIAVRRETQTATFQQIHVETAARIARVTKQAGIRTFVHLSTLEAELHAASRYARSKALGEEAVRAFFPHTIILRPSQMFGPGDHFFEWLASFARFTPIIPMFGTGAAKRQPVYVGDVAEAIVRTLQNPKAQGRVFELGGPEIFTRKQLLEITMEMLGYDKPVLPLPQGLAHFLAGLAEKMRLPVPNRDQLRRLEAHALVTTLPENTLEGLGILPASLRVILPPTLKGFRAAVSP